MVTGPQAIADTRRWLERAVIGLNLCPFAKAPHIKGLIHWAACTEPDDLAWLYVLEQELQALAEQPRHLRETTLLVLPNTLHDFLDFNDRLADADQCLADLRLVLLVMSSGWVPAN